jgi:polyisoprenoid-binding protein YceI
MVIIADEPLNHFGDTMFRLTLILLTACLPMLASADWGLAKSASSFTFTSTKNDTVTETHRFKEINGRVLTSGEANFEINLFSVDTSIEIRDQRMHDILFGLAPEAIFNANIDLKDITELASGVSITRKIEGNLQLHGFQQPLDIETKITALESGRIQVEGTGQIDVSAFGYSKGIEELRTIAGLNTISTIVNFQLKLTFREIEDS